MRRKLSIILPCLLLAALAAGHTAAWFAGTRYLATGFNAWVANRRAAGWQVDAGMPVRSGWPLAASLTVPGLALSAGPAGAPRPHRLARRACRAQPGSDQPRPPGHRPDRRAVGADRAGAGGASTADIFHAEVPLTRAQSTATSGPTGSLTCATCMCAMRPSGC